MSQRFRRVTGFGRTRFLLLFVNTLEVHGSIGHQCFLGLTGAKKVSYGIIIAMAYDKGLLSSLFLLHSTLRIDISNLRYLGEGCRQPRKCPFLWDEHHLGVPYLGLRYLTPEETAYLMSTICLPRSLLGQHQGEFVSSSSNRGNLRLALPTYNLVVAQK